MKKPNFLTRHLKETGENYFEHFLFGFSIAMWLTMAGFILFIHSIFPFIFPTTASKHVKKINEVMQKRVAMLLERIRKIEDGEKLER
jgi:hypothetical protein